MEGAYRAGMVAVIGKPNVGKSTFVNAIVGQKVSIVSSKPQTTRRRVLGIATKASWQAVFVDTPGIHTAHNQLGKALNQAAQQSVSGVDLVLVMVDSSRMPGKEDKDLALILEQAGVFASKTPVILCLNKMDVLKAANVERCYEAYKELFPAENLMMTSMTRDENVDLLVNMIVEKLPEGEPLYPEDQVTDQSMRFLAAELIREKALNKTRKEIPHAVACYIENWEENDKLARIEAVILVERDSQKGILIGKGGSMLKAIGTEARVEIQEILEKKVFLQVFVKVRDSWRGNEQILRELEYM